MSQLQSKAQPVLGLATMALGILFNVPYGILAVQYDYPTILRRPAGEALALFAAGGSSLILTWHAFALAAFALTPVAIALAITRDRLERTPALAIGAAIAGALAGVTQAMGLWRWVFVVPGLARDHAAAKAQSTAQAGAEAAFSILNQYGGVAIGEHLGQLLTALFLLLLATAQWGEKRPVTAITGFLAAATITIGTTEGVALAIGHSGDMFSLFTIAGFLGLTLWMLMTGLGLMRTKSPT